MVATQRLTVDTRGQGDVRDVTPLVSRALDAERLGSGTATIFVVGSTAGVTTIEFEPGAVADLDRAFERIAPRHGDYAHHLRWGDDNGSSHVRAALLGPSVTIPVIAGRLALGTWQQVVLVELDTGPRHREVIVQFVGEAIPDRAPTG
ncbi:MAG TPA: secondary thiamine-phosphate synthase enzyme YjbQ [Vicinamibacterales bacterium]|nr:secondary thiamine-phosphate synthase enzyme YjbQ [Vicinamibacterales bacterium]